MVLEVPYKKLLLAALLMVSGYAGAQVTILPLDKLGAPLAQRSFIGDIDHDGNHDILLSIQLSADSAAALLYRQKDSLQFIRSDTLPNLVTTSLYLDDIDNNGQTDVIAITRAGSQVALTAFLDYDTMEGFHPKTIYLADSIADFEFRDVNNDGLKDLLLIEVGSPAAPAFSIYLQKEGLTFQKYRSQQGITKFLASSFNNDGYEDLALLDQANQLTLLESTDYLKWDTLKIQEHEPVVFWEATDLNHDGHADILMTTDSFRTMVLINHGNFTAQDLTTSTSPILLQAAGDFTNDGFCDVTLSSKAKNKILSMDAAGNLAGIDSLMLPDSLRVNAFGDLNDDGKLDWIGTTSKPDSMTVYLLINSFPGENKGPQSLFMKRPFTAGNITNFSWSRAADDKTPTPSLSYDFYLRDGNTSDLKVAPDYNLGATVRLGKRQVSRVGYTNYDTLYLAYNLPSGKYFWGAAGVDNAYYSETDITDCNGLACSNSAFVTQCLEITRQDTLACLNETLHLQFGASTDSVAWFSVKQGDLGSGNSINYLVQGPDDVYAVAIPRDPCSDPLNSCTKNFNLTVKTHPTLDFFAGMDTTICKNTSFRIEPLIPDSVRDSVSYNLFADGKPVDSGNPQVVIRDTTLITIVGTFGTCTGLTDTLTVTPTDPPTITVTGKNQIYPGQSVALTATGATFFSWTPVNSLSSASTAFTVASPAQSTTYTVLGWDTPGCVGDTTFHVEILPSVYVPELFSPNNDGNNDRLIVHGSAISQLSFSIYDGNGRRIYSTTSVSQITGQGWDGTVNGVPIDPGTYVWIIGGKFSDGAPVTYQGRVKGELKIIR